MLNVVSSDDKCLELFDYFSTSQGVFSASVACGRPVRFERSDSFDNSVGGWQYTCQANGFCKRRVS